MSSSSSTKPRPPSAVFLAVLYRSKPPQASSSSSSSDEPDAAASLHEPLLDRASSSQNATTTTTTSQPGGSSSSLTLVQTRYLHFLSFVTGAWMAVLSQVLLSQTMWIKDLIDSTTLHIVTFSLIWSFWTCVVVFCSMLWWGRLLERRLPLSQNNNNNRTTATASLDTILFQMEAHHIVGALLSISALWMTVDVVQASDYHAAAVSAYQSMTGRQASGLGQALLWAALCVAGMLLWYPLMACLLPRLSTKAAENDDHQPNIPSDVQHSPVSGLRSTYHLIALTLGLITGLCSQFVLSFALWHQTWMTSMEQIVVFSLTWSVATVIWTAIGCASLRWIVQEGSDQNKNNDSTATTTTAERILFQMESRYIIGSLIGICLAWMVMDWVFQVREQILPCLLLLSLSLACFFVILACFPEEECFATLEDEQVVVTGRDKPACDVEHV